MTYYRKKQKEERKFPSFICPNCKKLTKLTFDPQKDIKDWLDFKCVCGYSSKHSE